MKAVLVERRHWEILLSELPSVVLASTEEELAETGVLPAFPPTDGSWGRLRELWRQFRLGLRRLRSRTRRPVVQPLAEAAAAVAATNVDPLRDPEGVTKLLWRYRVGEETVVGERRTRRFAEIASDLALVSWKALAAPSPPRPLAPVGWAIRLGRNLTRTVVGAPRWALVLLPVLLLVTSYLAIRAAPCSSWARSSSESWLSRSGRSSSCG